MNRHRRRRLLLILVGFIILGVIVFLATREKVLPKYIQTEEIETEKKDEIKCELVAPIKDFAFRLSIPIGMKKIDDNNSIYYLSDDINITVKLSNYNHNIYYYNTQTYLQSLGNNVELLSFDYPNTHNLVAVYRRNNENGDFTNIVLNAWDRKNLIEIVYEIPTPKYDKYIDTVKNSIDTYTWSSNYPISDNLVMGYDEVGNCDFAIPYGFSNASSNGVYAYINDNKTIWTTLEIFNNGDYLDKINNLAYTNYISPGKPNYALKNINVSKENLIAESAYTDSNTNEMIYMYQKIVATGKKQYFITYYVKKSALNDSVLELINNAFNYFTVRK